MPANHQRVRDASNEAWLRFHNTQKAYLQALIFVERAVDAAKTVELLKTVYSDLGESSAVLGLNQSNYFRSNLFFSQVSGMELYLQETLRSVIKEYPAKVGSTQFKLTQIAEAESIDILIDQATDEYLNKVMYKKPFEYLKDISDTLSINESALKPFWPAFVEAKARRDIGVHNNWICNATYHRKLNDVGMVSSVAIGASLAPETNEYLFAVTDALRNIAKTILSQVVKKYA